MSAIDVILPTYNQAEFLYRAIDSILKQTFKDITLIVVNDGSSDDTKNLLNEYDFSENKVVIENLEENKGLPYALNKGHSLGSSPYCTWVSTDNVSEKFHLEKLINKIVEGYDLVHGPYYKISGNKKQLKSVVKKGVLGGFLGPNFLYKRGMWEKFRYDEDVQGAEDYKFFAQVKMGGNKIGVIKDPSILYYLQNNSLTKKMGIPKIKKIVNKINKQLGI